jgi:hypothetical protein
MGQPVTPADPSKGSYSRYEAWQDLLMEAQWKPFEVLNKGKSVTLRRGQLMAARNWLASRWNWSEKTVRVFLSRLEEEFMVRTEQTARGHYNNILSICNYDIYQTVYELMRLTDTPDPTPNQGPEVGPVLGPEKGPEVFSEKPLKSAKIISISDRQGPEPGPVEGPEKGPQYNNVKNNNNLEREYERVREDGSSRLSESWYLPNEWGQWSMHECKRDREWVIAQAAKFKDYWLSVPDSKGFKKNWRSTWQNWCRNTLQREAKYGTPAAKAANKQSELYRGVL